MSGFVFIPRSVKRRKIDDQATQKVAHTELPLDKGYQIESEDSSKSSNSDGLYPRSTTNAVTTSKVKGREKTREPEERQKTDEEAGLSTRVSKSDTVPRQKQGRTEPDFEELAMLVCLALSDYALWADPDLRRKIDIASNDEEEGWNDERQIQVDSQPPHAVDLSENRGYVPLSYLFNHSPVFLHASSSPSFVAHPETAYVKALRMQAAQYMDVRLMVFPETGSGHSSTFTWSGNAPLKAGYEVRRNPSSQTREKRCGKADWDKLTVYMENIPIQHRSLPEVVKFVLALLFDHFLEDQKLALLQHISFPPHHQDKAGSLPTCKGFALVTFSKEEDVQSLLRSWPWEQTKSHHDSLVSDNHKNIATDTLKEAHKWGFRCLSKSLWEKLKAEYIIYRQQLVEEINVFQDAEDDARLNSITSKNVVSTREPSEDINDKERRTFVEEGPSLKTPEELSPSITADSAFPPGCLVFVRNVHPETNKTTLRSLFSQVWKNDDGAGDGLDYLDYVKGMDNCYVRLSTPGHANKFENYFSTHSTVQASGLDGLGTSSEKSSKIQIITLELVRGKREEVYWEKVPEKVRKQAVEKALKLAGGGNIVDAAKKRRKKRN